MSKTVGKVRTLVRVRPVGGPVWRGVAMTWKEVGRLTPVWGGLLFACLGIVSSAALPVRAAEPPGPAADPMRQLALTLRSLDSSKRLLYVTAHPDDEDTALLAYLRYAEGVETALMTLTRGEGGQNEIGPELFDALGVLRSRELEAAGRYTGVEQYYSRAFEFGYSFSVEETYAIWRETAIPARHRASDPRVPA